MILAIVQARMASKRLPGKVMKQVLGKPLIGYLLDRLSLSKKIDKIIVATSKDPGNDELCRYVKGKGVEVYRGREEDVLDRFVQAAQPYHPAAIVRVTADCPLIDYQVVDMVIDYYQKGTFDFVTNAEPPTFPNGLDVEVFSYECLKTTHHRAKEKAEREHVTLYMARSGDFKVGSYRSETDWSRERWTVDHEEDFRLIKEIIENLYPKYPYFGLHEILEYKREHPEIFSVNRHIPRNEVFQEGFK